MGLAENRAKSSNYAAYMKSKGIRRRTGQCPWGCGAAYSIDDMGRSLMIHLSRCLGGGRKRLSRLAGKSSRR